MPDDPLTIRVATRWRFPSLAQGALLLPWKAGWLVPYPLLRPLMNALLYVARLERRADGGRWERAACYVERLTDGGG